MFEKLPLWAKGLLNSIKNGIQTTATEQEETVTPLSIKPTTKLSTNDWERIERAMEQGIPVTCQVLASKKGGYTVSVFGTYAFMPNSLTHYRKAHTPDKVLGKELKVYIRSVKDGNVVVSHIEFVRKAYDSIAIGDVYDAVVAKILDKCILVYIPDNELYAIVSNLELSWSLETNISDYHPGQQVKVRIIKMNNIEKIRASIRQVIEANPYEKCINDYSEGDILTGTVMSVAEFGAFVKISEGVIGLLHRSEVRWMQDIPNMKDIFKFGDKVKVVICRIDYEQGRIFLSLKRLNMEILAEIYKVGSIHTVRIASIEDKVVTLQLPYDMATQVRRLRFAKMGINPLVGMLVDIQILSFSPDNNEVKVTLA